MVSASILLLDEPARREVLLVVFRTHKRSAGVRHVIIGTTDGDNAFRGLDMGMRLAT